MNFRDKTEDVERVNDERKKTSRLTEVFGIADGSQTFMLLTISDDKPKQLHYYSF